MGQMFDAVNPGALPAEAEGKAALHITVLASLKGEAFDLEAGNAGAASVAASMAYRLSKGLWSVGYVNESTFSDLEAAMGPKGLTFTDAQRFPAPGVYLWCADPSGNIAAGRWRLPVAPVAVQDQYPGPYDVSRTAATFPAEAAGYIDGPRSQWPIDAWAKYAVINGGGWETLPHPQPAPQPAPPPVTPSEVTVLVPVLQEGVTAAPVRAVQTLVGGITVDGIFGPVTHARVVEFQAAHGLTQDGIVGQHTWGQLLGAPQ